jgi:hypothetical protein
LKKLLKSKGEKCRGLLINIAQHRGILKDFHYWKGLKQSPRQKGVRPGASNPSTYYPSGDHFRELKCNGRIIQRAILFITQYREMLSDLK